MSVDAKVNFVHELECKLADKITVADMAKIVEAANDTLQGYEMQTIINWDAKEDDFLECYISAMGVECRSDKTIERYKYVISKMTL